SDMVAAGNLLANTEVPRAMVDDFAGSRGLGLHFGERLLAALEAGLARGGEAGAVHSAGLLVVRDQPWPLVDLRVDWSESNPVEELRRLWQVYYPQMEDYVVRALDPARAPGFGVPGDE
ncbi:MAG: DUF1028 domain-containing protein, partial [Alphaproteobacteria bacterium]